MFALVYAFAAKDITIGFVIVFPTGVVDIPTDTGLEVVLKVDTEQVTTHLKSVATDIPLVNG